jgi:ATP/maltotriose-dependent transcriptional regulator MalT
MGHCDEALELLAEARAMFVASGEHGELIETDARIAECLVLQGKPAEALEFVTQTLARVAATPGVAPQLPLLHRVRGYAHVQLGDLTTARVAMEESLDAARARGAEHEEALTLEALNQLDSALGLPIDAAREEARAALFDRLGIVATPEVPLEEAGATT